MIQPVGRSRDARQPRPSSAAAAVMDEYPRLTELTIEVV